MSIDWVTFVAQIVNLAILVYLLYKFMFKPLLAAIDKREAYVADKVSQAEASEALLKKRLSELNKKNEEIEEERKSIVLQAHKDADELRLSLENQVRLDAEKTRLKWQQELEQERISLQSEMTDLVLSNFRKFSEKAFLELADTTLEAQMIEAFKRHFIEMEKNKEKRLFSSDKESVEAIISTAYDLSDNAKSELKKVTGFKNVVFKVDTAIACGIDLSVEDEVLSWTLEAYLRDFIESMKEAIEGVSSRLAVPE